MDDREQRIAELRQEIDRFRLASQVPMSPAVRRVIRAYLNICVKEYIRLVERLPRT